MATLDEVLSAASETVTVDLSGSEDYQKVGAGSFISEITSVETGTSKAGNPVLVWKAKVAAGEELEGSFIPIFSTNLDGGGSFRSARIINAIDLDPAAFALAKAVGRKVRLVTEIDGEYVNVVDYKAVE